MTLRFLQGAPRTPGRFGKSSAPGAHTGTGFAGRQEYIVPVKSEAAELDRSCWEGRRWPPGPEPTAPLARLTPDGDALLG